MRQTPAEQVAGAVRAELARRQVSGRKLAEALGWSFTTTARRLNGSSPFDIDELVTVASFLGVPVGDLLPQQATAA
jgi:transcriptional regulator with XRE-family HTH domain